MCASFLVTMFGAGLVVALARLGLRGAVAVASNRLHLAEDL